MGLVVEARRHGEFLSQEMLSVVVFVFCTNDDRDYGLAPFFGQPDYTRTSAARTASKGEYSGAPRNPAAFAARRGLFDARAGLAFNACAA